jgi:uncharacterized protein (DUF433 family)
MTLNPLALGFYSVQEAAKLIEVGSTRRIYGWLRGYEGRKTGPLIDRQFEPLDGREEISFLDLMELRLIETLREQEVKPRTIRRAIVAAREMFKSSKPFATNRIFLKTDGRDVFVEEILKKVAQEENDKRLWNLITKQYEHYELIERSLLSGVTFDPENHLAKTWKPRADRYPDVIIDPRIAYGKPITPSRAPTATLYELYKAESGSISAAAEYFQIPLDEAEMGIRFEEDLLPREKLAA